MESNNTLDKNLHLLRFDRYYSTLSIVVTADITSYKAVKDKLIAGIKHVV